MDPLPPGIAAELASRPRLLQLQPAVQRYAWGGYEFIPRLLGDGNEHRVPHAELWLGTHPVAPAAALIGGHRVSLAALLETAAPAVMGTRQAAVFGCALPYLLKVLDVRSMLSIQAHPDEVQARDGFDREERLGIPRTSPERNYRDSNHKPEASLALTEFWMLIGFRPPRQILALTESVPELAAILDLASVPRTLASDEAEGEWLRDAYGRVMRLPQDTVDRALGPLESRLEKIEADGRLDRRTPEFWALRAAREFRPPHGGVDRGVASVFFLNLLRLERGQAVFIPAGRLHAYLEGVAVEVMAASDNVLRGGLTPKHVDVDELLRVLRFDAGVPVVLDPQVAGPNLTTYRTPAAEFRLDRIDLETGDRLPAAAAQGADLLFVVEGSATVQAGADCLEMGRGGAVLAPHGLVYSVSAPERALVVRARIPQ